MTIDNEKILCKKISKNAKNGGKKKYNLVTLPSWIGRHRQQKLHTWTAWLEKTREMIHFQQHQKKTCENTGEIFHESLPKITKTLMYPHFSCIYRRRWNLDRYFKFFFGEKSYSIHNRFQNLEPVSNERCENSTFYDR